MIVDKLVGWTLGLISWLLDRIPAWSPADHLPPIGTIVDSLQAPNYYLPIAELVVVMLAVIGLGPAFVTASLAFWAVALIRGGSSRG